MAVTKILLDPRAPHSDSPARRVGIDNCGTRIEETGRNTCKISVVTNLPTAYWFDECYPHMHRNKLRI